ncbi:MAG: hypothetical protein ACYTG3_08190 [Planctomycetota bacterium]
MSRFWLVSFVLAAACGGSASPGQGELYRGFIDFNPTGQGWTGDPVLDDLGEVSNNGAGYTGEIDLYEMTTPGPGRLQVSLSWDHDADFDLFLASDPEGKTRLAQGNHTGSMPEYLGIPVAGGQTVYILVAGWEGEPGPYELETILLHPGAPVFDLAVGPSEDTPWPSNVPLAFTFNVELDPDQDLDARVFFVGPGHFAEGSWCIQGNRLLFYPRLPSGFDDPGGLRVGDDYTLQFPPAARGVRAVSGEYLTDVETLENRIGPPADLVPDDPPRAVTAPPTLVWNGEPITIAFTEPLDPDTLFPVLWEIDATGLALPLPSVHTLSQRYLCGGELEVRLVAAPDTALQPGSTLRLVVPGTTTGLGDPRGLAGPAPAPAGSGFQVDFTVP